LVRKEIPRFPKKLEEVKTQKVSEVFEEHVGSDVHGLGGMSCDGMSCEVAEVFSGN
jgi:hypothetical protein